MKRYSLVDLSYLEPAGADDVGKVFGDMHHLERQGLAIHGSAQPAQSAVCVAALG